jgi:hypothetical protein
VGCIGAARGDNGVWPSREFFRECGAFREDWAGKSRHQSDGTTVKLAIITPAFSKHLPLLELSAEGVDRHCPADIHHYVIVSRQEEHLFRRFRSARRSVVAAEDILPRAAFRLPVLVRRREVWLTDWHRLVRGWIMQQAIKLSAPEITDADAFLFLDTDVFFIRPFTVDKVVHDGRVRLLRNPGMGELETHKSWHRTAAKLLGLPVRDYFGADFIGNAITWRRDACLEMRDRIASVGGAHWFSMITRQTRLSEYILYGIFVQEVLGSQDLRHMPTSDEICLNSWDFDFPEKPEDRARLLAERLRPYDIAINIQSSLRLPANEFRSLLDSAVAIAAASS